MKKLLIVDDHEIVRDGLKRILVEQPDALSFGEAGTASEALLLAEREPWDAVVLDLSLCGRNGLEVLKQLKHIRPKLPVLILSMHSEEQYARRAFAAGAAGYITKDSPRAELVRAILKVLDGGRYISLPMAERLAFETESDQNRPLHTTLSNRELEVLCRIAAAKTVSEIGAELSLSDKTISTYRARLLRKMEMKNNADLMRYAMQNGLVD